jgi:hypothetical protein
LPPAIELRAEDEKGAKARPLAGKRIAATRRFAFSMQQTVLRGLQRTAGGARHTDGLAPKRVRSTASPAVKIRTFDLRVFSTPKVVRCTGRLGTLM